MRKIASTILIALTSFSFLSFAYSADGDTNELEEFDVIKVPVFEKQELVKNRKQIDKNIINKEFLVVDARSRSRFNGEEPEPRKGLRSGSIPNSLCLPFKECINEDHTFKKKKTSRVGMFPDL